MGASHLFLDNYTDYLILIYALSFLVMSVAIFRQEQRTAHSDLLQSLFMLALFGVLRAFSEIIPLVWNLLGLPQSYATAISYARVGLIILSFQFLVYFAFMMLTEPGKRLRWFVLLTPLVIAVHYVVGTNIASETVGSTRYLKLLLAFPASLASAVAFFSLSQKLKSLRLTTLMWDSRVLAVAFVAYGLSIIPRAFRAIAIIGATEPIVVLRTIPVIVITVFVYRILAIFELEPRKSKSSPELSASQT